MTKITDKLNSSKNYGYSIEYGDYEFKFNYNGQPFPTGFFFELINHIGDPDEAQKTINEYIESLGNEEMKDHIWNRFWLDMDETDFEEIVPRGSIIYEEPGPIT